MTCVQGKKESFNHCLMKTSILPFFPKSYKKKSNIIYCWLRSDFGFSVKIHIPHSHLARLTVNMTVLRTVPTNKRYFFPGVWLCRKRRSQQVLLKSEKKTGGNHAFFKDNSWIISVKSLKIQSNVWRSFSNWSVINFSLKNVWLPHIFFLDTNGTYKDILPTDSFKPHKNITVFESITDRKTKYLEMRRTYAQ